MGYARTCGLGLCHLRRHNGGGRGYGDAVKARSLTQDQAKALGFLIPKSPGFHDEEWAEWWKMDRKWNEVWVAEVKKAQEELAAH